MGVAELPHLPGEIPCLSENQYVVEAFNSKLDQVMMLGHTHPNYGPTRRCFSIADILFGITYISWLRQRMPQSPYEVCFSLAYMGDDGVLKHVPLMYDPSLQKRGGSAIFLLDYKRL